MNKQFIDFIFAYLTLLKRIVFPRHQSRSISWKDPIHWVSSPQSPGWDRVRASLQRYRNIVRRAACCHIKPPETKFQSPLSFIESSRSDMLLTLPYPMDSYLHSVLPFLLTHSLAIEMPMRKPSCFVPPRQVPPPLVVFKTAQIRLASFVKFRIWKYALRVIVFDAHASLQSCVCKIFNVYHTSTTADAIR